jgi:ribonuclease VapC
VIVIDTSALIALHDREVGHDLVWSKILAVDTAWLPACCFLEAVMVLKKRNRGRDWLERFIEEQAIDICAFSRDMARRAADAFERYGKGRGHRAQLNFGDCMVYATASVLSAPLLYVGQDFTHTDIVPAL